MNLLFFLFIIIGGVISTVLPVEVYPDASLDWAEINTVWFGASAEEVERLITKVIEDEIEDVRGVARMVSDSSPNISSISIKFREDLPAVDLQAAFDDLRLSLDRVVDLPETAEEPELVRITMEEVLPLVQVAVVDEENVGEAFIRRVALDLRDELRNVPGLSKITPTGMRDREIHVRLERPLLEQYGVSLQQVSAVLASQNRNVPAGPLDGGDTEIELRSIGEAESPEALGDICIVRSPTGGHVRLRDLGTIEESFSRAIVVGRIRGKPAVALYVAKHRQANALTVRDAVEAYLADYRERHDLTGVSAEITGDSTTMISSRLGVLRNNLSVGLALVFIGMWFFIGVRNSLLALIGIPFSFLCAIIFMYTIGVSLNAVSVFSLVLVSGLIVDDAIVVLENIYRHVQEGKPLREAVVIGTEQVMWPVLSSTATTMAAFLPLLLMPGMLGRFFSIIPKTVAVALLASLFECLIILPCHYLDWGARRSKKTPEPSVPSPAPRSGGWRERLLGLYDAVLVQVLRYRYVGLVALTAMGVFAWQTSRTLTVEMFPSDFPTFMVDFNTREEAGLEETTRVVEHLFPVIDQFMPHDVAQYATIIGAQVNEDNRRILQTHLVQMWLDVTQGTHGYRDPTEVMNDVRRALNEYVAAHPECGVKNLRAWSIRDGPPMGKPVAIRVEHTDYEVAREVADRIKDELRSYPGVRDVTDNLRMGHRELQLRVKEDVASELGLTFLDVATAFRGANDGLKVGVYKDTENDEDVDIKVMYADKYLQSVDALGDIDIETRNGGWVKLHQVADVTFDQTYASRFHYNTRRTVQVTADVDTRVTDARHVSEAVLRKFLPLTEEDNLLKLDASGQYAETKESFTALRQSGAIALCLIYLILASQFRSYVQPVIVLMAVSFGVAGMVFALVLNDYSFSIVTAIAMVGMCGVAVNDALVLLDFINVERRGGASVVEALRVSCRRRARPIVLTTLTTVAGLAPMALGVGGFSKIWSPFAMSMCWGLLTATLLTLILVPAFYHMVEDGRGWVRRCVGGEDESTLGE
ncbi:MAG: efflux RND transporter permease subunit [bacterium]|nr:efflux RND transporter permease subunit [bacterium]